jgi:hypothetical protein
MLAAWCSDVANHSYVSRQLTPDMSRCTVWTLQMLWLILHHWDVHLEIVVPMRQAENDGQYIGPA